MQKQKDPLRQALGRVAYASRRDAQASNPEALTDARRDFAAAKIERCIREQTAAAPPLTPDQREHLAGLLRAGGSGE